MRTATDALRSLRRWYSVILPEPWDVQYVRDENLERPSAIVQPATAQQNSGSAYVRDMARNYDAFIYPTGFEGDPMRSRMQAEGLAAEIDRAMAQGVMLSATRYYSRAMRLPVFDYNDVPWDQALPSGAEPYDFYPVDQWSVEVRLDPDDDTLFTIVCQCRLRWRMDGDMSRFIGKPLEEVPIGYAPKPLQDVHLSHDGA